MKTRWNLLALACGVLLSVPVYAQTIPVIQLNEPPQLDGNAEDWQAYQATDVPLQGELAIQNVSVKSGVAGDDVYFFFQWKDDSHDAVHKPYKWDVGKGKYSSGEESEDRFAINFGMEGDFTHDWFSGNSFKADMWHWKAARSNPLGLAQDKLTIISTQKKRKAYQAKAKNGTDIYIERPSDSGDKLYTTARYATKEQDVMPKYILNHEAKGSITDVKAKGVWVDGQWTLELKRKLNTGNPDDIVFVQGQAVLAAIAIFNHSGDEHHDISGTITIQF